MKMRTLKTCALLLAALLAGCAGQNHTLFMTKSNAGLDLDTKPPTAEINISRKEGVVAPTFEGGQTPPVVASFGGQADGRINKFLFGVDQTFAGGDAAVTMATLFAAPTPDAGNKNACDSTLTLDQKPKANAASPILKFLFGLAEPGDVRPLIFGTDTQLGVKVGWTGTGGPYPDNLKIGFNRKEAAFAPVTMKEAREKKGGKERTTYAVKMPSFLATVSHDVKTPKDKGSTDQDQHGADVTFIQYFATGLAADALSRQQAVRVAMIGRMDPKQDAVLKAIKDAETEGRVSFDSVSAKIDKIVTFAAPQGTILESQLKILSGGLDLVPKTKTWIDNLKDKPAKNLRENLLTANFVFVEDLHKNIPRN